jgi:NAD+ kinase
MNAAPSARPPARPIARVGIVAKADLHEAAQLLDDLADWLQAKGIIVIFEAHTATLRARYQVTPEEKRDGLPHLDALPADDLPAAVDMILLLGGDGTLLGTADRIAMAGAETPILGVNFGSLGFLTETTLPELYDALQTAISGNAPIEERVMLRAQILRNGDILSDVCLLNDVVITRGALSRMTDLSVSVNDQFVARFRADGLIVATATGSTAYNLSAGGPIVHPGVDALVITPIAPHTLTNRPVVIPAASILVIQPLPEPVQQDVFVTFDGQIGFPLPPDQSVRVTRADHPLRLVRPTTRSYFEVLRQKLKWAERA